MYMPELITAGRVYRAVPPLFSIKGKGGTKKYFTTKLDLTKYVQNLFSHQYSLSDPNGKRLTNAETTNLFYKNIEYKDDIEFISNTFAIDPDVLETVLYYLADYVEIGSPSNVAAMAAKTKVVTDKKKATAKKTTTKKKTTKKETSKEETTSESGEDAINFNSIPVTEGSVSASMSYYIKPTFNAKTLKTQLKKHYRFIDLVESNGVIRIEGLVNSKYQYVFINDKFVAACIPLIMAIKNNLYLYYKVDGENVTLYQLMCKFNDMIPAGLVRYKGLGEQNPQDLGESALRPDGDRTLIRYTIESAKEEIESLRRIDSSMASLLREVSITKAEIE